MVAKSFPNGDEYDLFAQMDPIEPPWVCTGFVYYRSNNKTMELMEKWITHLTRLNARESNQPAFNTVMRKIKDLKLKALNMSLFLSGKYYFHESWRRTHPEVKPVMLHNNYVLGHDKKVDRFKQLGMWYV